MTLVAALLSLPLVLPANAAPVRTIDGVVIITQADALAGGVTAGDTPGYPITISASGSYRLGGPLTVTTNQADGFVVTAPLVTLDFNRFALDGGGIGSNGVEGTQRSLSVYQGTIRNFDETGIESLSTELIVSDMRIADIGKHFVSVLGLDGGRGIVRDSVFQTSFQDGVSCQSGGCLIQHNVVSDTFMAGIWIGTSPPAVVYENVVSRARLGGIYVSGDRAGLGRNTLVENTSGGSAAPITGAGSPGSLGRNVCSPVPSPVPEGC